MTPDPLAVLLRKQGWEPDSNVCRCGHLGGEHDLNNWCLTCQPPRSDYFASYSQGELWDNAVASLRAAGVTLAPTPDPLREDAQADWITPSGPLDKDPI